MASPNKVEIDVTADTAQALSGLGAVKREMSAVGSSASSLEGFAKGAGAGLNQVGQAGETATTGLGKTRAGITSISEQLSAAKTQFGAFIAAQLGLSTVKEVGRIADDYKNLEARIKLATGTGKEFATGMEGVVAVAQRTNSNLENTGNLFAKLTDAGKSAGLSTQDAVTQSLRLTETINQAVQLSGASAGASSAALTQLIQGLQGGVLRGDEFNSVMEQSPRLAKALADGLGVTTGELRKMAEAGSLSADTVITALKGQSETLKSEFATLPPTVGRALENLSTSWQVYLGEASKASGVSETAAKAINLLSGNLSTVGGLLIDAGQAAAGFTAYNLAKTFLGIGTASAQAAAGVATNTTATVINTTAHQTNTAAAARESLAFKALAADVAAQAAALGGNTASTVANTAAKTASGAAADVAAAGVGRFAAVLSTLKTFSLIGLLTNIQDIGTALGEGAAKLAGYKDRTEELARAEKLSAAIAADNQALRERGEALTKRAIEKQFELSKAAVLSIGEFDKLTKAGDTAAEAVAKIGKDFDLSKQPGIRDAAAVLDKLAADGKLSASEFEGAWSKALKSVDLGVFETQSRAAFAGSAREAERLAQVLDATLRESIRRTGLDFDVIKGGMGKAAASAVNDTEVMIAGLERLKKQGVDTGQVLTASISKGIQTADSQKAIEAVRSQIEALRQELGAKVADGLLEQAAQKSRELVDELNKAKPGIQGLREAMQELGLKTREELGSSATKAKEAYAQIMASGQQEGESYAAWQNRKAEAFEAYAKRAIAGNGGVASEALKTEAAIRGLSIEGGKAGDSISRAMQGAQGSVQALGNQVQFTTEQLAAQAKQLDEINSKYGQGIKDREFKTAKVGSGNGSVLTKDPLTAVDNSGLTSLQAKRRNGTLGAEDLRTAQAVFDTAAVNKEVFDKNATAFSLEGARSIIETYNAARVLLDEVKGLSGVNRISAAPVPQPQPVGGRSPAPSQQIYVVKIDLGGGRTRDVNVASANDAQALIQSLKDARLAA